MAIHAQCPQCHAKYRVKDSDEGQTILCRKCETRFAVASECVPDFDVFISHSSKDAQVANAVCASLENSGIRCWIAPRNISAGESWGSAIMGGIESTRLMIVVLTRNSNASTQVIREINQAVSSGAPVLPLLLDHSPLSREMRYFLSTTHWLDAVDKPLEESLEKMKQDVKSLLSGEAASTSLSRPPFARKTIQSKLRVKQIAGVVVATVLGLIAIGWAGSMWNGDAKERAPSPGHTNTDAKNEWVALIEDNVRPDFWVKYGGLGTVQCTNDILTINATPAVHEDIYVFLSEYRTIRGLPITSLKEGQRVQAALDEVTTQTFVEIPLSDAIHQISEAHDIPIVIDTRALEDIGLMADDAVNVSLKNVSLRSLLRLMLNEFVDLTYMIKDDVIYITTTEVAERNLVNKVYPIGDLPSIQVSGQGVGQGGGQGGGGQGGEGFGGGGVFAVSDDVSLNQKRDRPAD